MRRAAFAIVLVLVLAPAGAPAELPVTQSPHGNLQWDCQECHTSESWSQMRDSLAFSHDETGFALRGAHASARCAGCHTSLVFAKADNKCDDCHDDTHQGRLGTDCASCHSPYSWLDKDALFDRHAARGFALTGVHAVADCDACHLDQQPRDFAAASSECQSCHNDDFVAVIEPNHVAAGFSAKCEACHGRAADTWAGATYEHPATFPLIEGHANVTCNTCHSETYAETSTDCVSCHEQDYTDAKDPDHVGAQLSQNCQDCHTIVAWSPAEFDHDLAGFTLTGAHLTADCAGCHAERYTGTPSECVACHEIDVLAASDPNHEEAGFPKTCAVCHSTDAWKPSHIDHNLTRFTLTGTHAEVDCSSCHAAGYTGTSSECYACHNDDFASVNDPNHVTNNFSHACVPCHNTTAWLPAEFDHNLTEFPLTGAHVSVECGVCHTSGYDQTSTACYSCHESDYAGAQDPDHAGNNFDHDCASCHTPTAWRPAEFDHNLTDFPLTGAHAEVDCASCHSEGYTGTSSDCYACHESDYNAVADPDHAGSGFDHNCQQCHTTAAWLPAEFDHDQAAFKLTGAHAATDCNACHASGFTGTPMECFACHEQNYNDTGSPDHALTGLDHDCAVCHSTSAWEPSSFDHNTTRFLLTGAHTGAACNACHEGTTTGLATECYACHESDYAGTVDPDHVGSQFPTECGVCHSTTAWRPSNIDHNLTSFPLTGAHIAVDCNSCHADGYTGTPSDCYSCHNDDFAGVDDPDHVQGGFDHDCTICHTTNAWLPVTFDHNLTDFPLAGAHAATDCNSCHVNGYAGTPTECYACHESDYNATIDPDHAGSGLPTTCGVCHSVDAWRPSRIDHSLTRFPLRGAHVSVDCATCHTGGYTGTPSECFACHESDYLGAADPDHAGSGFDHACGQCHSTAAWQPAGFDHNLAEFKVTGAHTAVDCASCHTAGFTGTPQDCYACHGEDFADASDPNHALNNFDHDCTTCHTTSGWTPLTFDHQQTNFPLTGVHAATLCIDCHGGGYAGTPVECFACHESDFNRTDDPDHVANKFGHNCAACHNTNAWEPADFNHDQTGFPLVGAHRAVACVTCHTSGYTNTASDCIACHQDDFNSADDPDHIANNFDHDCTACHSMNGWSQSTFDHNQTAFPLTGAHAAPLCIDCHSNGYAGTPVECFACHESNFNGTTDPDHVANNFGHTCAACHNTNAWRPADFNHDQTSFPLVGAHLAVDCITCHTNGYTSTSSDCIVCHESDYNGVSDPNHVTNNFDHDCTVCHSLNRWSPSAFDHNQTRFPLSGAHTATQCIDCHGAGYAGTPLECFACHESDFNGTTDPDHVANNFGHTCAACHNTNAWQPADFNHDETSFPLQGAHLAVDCIMCHTNGYTSTASDCMACHESDYNGVGDPNHVANSFDHDCTTCHSLNGWTPATFDHDQTGFALTGGHAAVNCIECHSAGYANTSTDCYSCHAFDYNDVSDPNHLAGGFNHNCTQCHTTNAWQPAGYDHNLSQFALTGAHLTVTCAQCHTNGYTGTPMECFACHESDYASVSDPSHVTNNFDHDCTQCHGLNGWLPSTFDHNKTDFQLTGAHTVTLCIDCHGAGYIGTPMECFACHESDFNGTTDPDHVANNFGHTCAACHNTNTWRPAEFDHNETSFPLEGAHLAVDCINCHANGYTSTSTDCLACHESDFDGVSDPNHVTNNFDHDCTACHSMNGWTPSTFDHNQTAFPLTGAHTATLCIDCHGAGYAGTPIECFACHESDFNSTVDPDHVANNFGHTCAACHNTNAWRPADFDHNNTSFPLEGAHLAVDCVTCHTSGYTSTSSDCMACHETDYIGVNDPNHVTNNFDHDCTACHSMNAWLPSAFDHNQTAFPLTGVHTTTLCVDCHSSGYTDTPTDCFACHSGDYNGVSDPNHPLSGFSHDCVQCHTTSSWTPADYDHDLSQFKLTGAHVGVACVLCHASGYSGTPMECFACHETDYTGVVDPDHLANNFDHDCTACHNMDAWSPATFEHNQTSFPLTGAHTVTLCIDCHGAGYTGTPLECFACHESDFNSVADPDHVANNFGHDCAVCHNTSAWQPSDFDHNETNFPLEGAHLAVNCVSCHTAGYTNTPTDCFACHENDFSGVEDPNHVTNNFDHDCRICHGINEWSQATFDHNQTAFPLTGAHATTTCIDCHSSGYSGTSTDCYACHSGDFNAVSDPNHLESGFSHACVQCHTTNGWQPADYDHNLSQFKLTGAHLAVTCVQCHTSGYTVRRWTASPVTKVTTAVSSIQIT